MRRTKLAATVSNRLVGMAAGAGLGLAALAAPAAADAAVLYSFSQTGAWFGDSTFTFTAPDFITADQFITPDTCWISIATNSCGLIEFDAAPLQFDVSGSLIAFNYEEEGGGGGGWFFFSPDAFSTLGVHTTDGWPVNDPDCCYGSAGAGVLTVSTLSSAVPEPLTWSLMIAGFGMAGAALRRRRAFAVLA